MGARKKKNLKMIKRGVGRTHSPQSIKVKTIGEESRDRKRGGAVFLKDGDNDRGGKEKEAKKKACPSRSRSSHGTRLIRKSKRIKHKHKAN